MLSIEIKYLVQCLLEKQKIRKNINSRQSKRSLNKDDLVITDNDNPIALAGVMGGLETEVTENTKTY